MTNQDFRREPVEGVRAREGMSEWTKAATGDRSGASSFVEDAAEKVKQAASSTAASLTGDLKELLNRQVGSGADKLACVARSARVAAHDLERDSPAVAELARTLAARVDAYGQRLRGRSVDEIWRDAADFTRRQPALVLGLSALAGFFAMRLLKSNPPISAPSIQPSHSYQPGQGGVGYGS
ncbi:MAG TPA: hypothetical protein VH678_15610 [Xanthobacteraceae bacterium]|jgi:hypothetical protein